MAKAGRPSLTAIIEKNAGGAAEPAPAPRAASERKPGKRRMGWSQLNVYVPEELRIKVKVKALQEDRDVSDVVTELLTAWTEQN